MATIGSLLTFSMGTALAAYFQSKEPKPEPPTNPKANNEQEEEDPPAEEHGALFPSTPKRKVDAPAAGVEFTRLEKTNLLTGIPVADDIYVAPAEVVIDPDHKSPSTWATGASYKDPRPEPISEGVFFS